jgi:hypothetical protein
MSQQVAITHSDLANLRKVGDEAAMNTAAVRRSHDSAITGNMMPGFLGAASGKFLQLHAQDLSDMDKIQMHFAAMRDLVHKVSTTNMAADEQHVAEIGKLIGDMGGGSGLNSTINAPQTWSV